MKPCIVVHYDEIGLKGKNRSKFEHQLMRNIRRAVESAQRSREEEPGPVRVERWPGRLMLPLHGEAQAAQYSEVLRKVFGIAYFAAGWTLELDLAKLEQAVLERAQAGSFESFAVRARRANKGFELNSQQLNERLGRLIQQQSGARVDLEHPHRTFYVDILDRQAILTEEKVRGPGGVPVGISGEVVCLISGGIDSPVAAYLMMKRGCRVGMVHFHSHPFTSTASQQKVRDLLEILKPSHPRFRLAMVPFAECQRVLVREAPAPLRVILYRRFMARIAQQLARRWQAGALVTGESLGQVASQTLGNLAVVEAVVQLPLFRPLIGMDKREIVELARRIGTYELSIGPHDDCCSYLMPRHPATWSKPDQLDQAEAGLDVEALVQETLHRATEEWVPSRQLTPGTR